MGDSLNRRDWLRVLGISGVAAGLSSLRTGNAGAQESGFQSSIVNSNEVQANRASPSLIDGKVVQTSSGTACVARDRRTGCRWWPGRRLRCNRGETRRGRCSLGRALWPFRRFVDGRDWCC